LLCGFIAAQGCGLGFRVLVCGFLLRSPFFLEYNILRFDPFVFVFICIEAVYSVLNIGFLEYIKFILSVRKPFNKKKKKKKVFVKKKMR
jgi:hypothetical protein